MQFLQKLILSHNPLSVITDPSFFKLPSVKYLDLGATRVTQQTLLTLLLTTAGLETLKLPSDVACCFCQEEHTTETSCRTIEFHCENLCINSVPHCARTSAETRGEIKEAGRSSSVLNLKPEEPSLGDRDTVTLTVILSLTSLGGDLSNPNGSISRSNSHSPQHLPRQEGKANEKLMLILHRIQHMGWTSEAEKRKLYFLAKALAAELEKQLSKAKSIVTLQNTASSLPAPAVQKDEAHKTPAVEGETTMGRVPEQHAWGSKQAVLHPWEEAGRLDPMDDTSVFRHHKIPAPPSKPFLPRPPAESPRLSMSFKIPSYFDAVEQTKKTQGMEGAEDVEDLGDVAYTEEAPPPMQDYDWTYKRRKREDSLYLDKDNDLFYEAFGNENPEEEPPPTESKAEQRLNANQRFFYNLLINNSLPDASSVLTDTAEEEGSFLGGRLPPVPRTMETHLKQQKEESSLLNKSGSSNIPSSVPVQRNLFEAKVNEQLHLLVADEAVRAFMAYVARALRRECRLRKLRLTCAKLVSKTGLLVQLLSKKHGGRRASALMDECLLEGDISSAVAHVEDMDRNATGKAKLMYDIGDGLQLAISMSVMIMVVLLAVCIFEACSRKHAAVSGPQSTGKSCPSRFFQKLLPRRWRRNEDDIEQGLPGSDPSENNPLWLGARYQPLDAQQEAALAELCSQESSDEEEIFQKTEAGWMPTAPQKSDSHGEVRPPGDPPPLPHSSGAPQQPQPPFPSTAEGAPGGH
ncbi:leucine-rich repeat-containing protein 37A2-like [Nyctibius grandis]|uniref:leucine-rich repeat-containing protein 37A2-like n=1 Tax=Nyctibius grandis TaxID=48427 RepID=UPI0035BBD9E1